MKIINGDELRDLLMGVMSVVSLLVVLFALYGCAYRGGKIIDGTNLAVGISVPGTEWQINALDYIGGLRVAGQDRTIISVTNEVAETNRYFGVIETQRHAKMSATIEPTENIAAGLAVRPIESAAATDETAKPATIEQEE